jgi:hypothetical protein
MTDKITLEYERSGTIVEVTKKQNALMEVTVDGEFEGIVTGHELVKALENGVF